MEDLVYGEKRNLGFPYCIRADMKEEGGNKKKTEENIESEKKPGGNKQVRFEREEAKR